MDINQRRVLEARARLFENINQSTQAEGILQKSEQISIGEFKDRLEKGETFLTKSQVDQFQKDVAEKVTKTFDPESKNEILEKAQAELSLLKGVIVTNEIGQKFNFFAKGESEEELLEKGKKANVGEIRVWKGEKQQKQADGSWKKVNEGKAEGKKQDSESENQYSYNVNSFLKKEFKTVVMRHDNSPYEIPGDSIKAKTIFAKNKNISLNELENLISQGIVKHGIQNKRGEDFNLFKMNAKKLASIYDSL